jgi:hypothetical protein
MTPGSGSQSPAHVVRYLHGVAYPAGKGQLVAQAHRNGAPEEVCRLLETLDADEFYGVQDVMRAAAERLH